MDIASSASSSSSSSSSASDSGSEDELTPSPLRGGDESVELEASKFKPDSGGDDKSYGSADSGEESEGGDGQEDETLGDQLAARRHDGVRGPNRSGAEEARRRALAVASGRLAALREEKKIKDGTVTSEGGTTKKRRRKRGAEPFFEEERSESLSDGSDCEGLEAATSAKLDEDPISSKNTSKARKKSKHRPTEASSKRSDYYARGAPNLNSSGLGVAVGANRYKPRDPRMQSLSGHFDATLFDHKYEFLEKVQEDEIKQLKKRLVARKKSGRSGLKARRKLGLTQPGAGSLEVRGCTTEHLCDSPILESIHGQFATTISL